MTPVDLSVTEDPSELSNQITAPGILKIFGSEICEGAHYKSVLATTHSSAKELVKEALERFVCVCGIVCTGYVVNVCVNVSVTSLVQYYYRSNYEMLPGCV